MKESRTNNKYKEMEMKDHLICQWLMADVSWYCLVGNHLHW